MTTNDSSARTTADLWAAAAHYHEGVRFLPDGPGRVEARMRLSAVMKELEARGERIR